MVQVEEKEVEKQHCKREGKRKTWITVLLDEELRAALCHLLSVPAGSATDKTAVAHVPQLELVRGGQDTPARRCCRAGGGCWARLGGAQAGKGLCRVQGRRQKRRAEWG